MIFALFALLAGVNGDRMLAGSFLIASSGLLLLFIFVWLRAAHSRRFLHYGFAPKRVQYIQVAMQSCIYGYWGWYWPEVYRFIPLIAAQVLFAYTLDMLVNWTRRDKWICGFGPIPVVLSTNLFLWFRNDWFILQFLMIAVALLGKEFIKWERDGHRTHIFNPSALGLFAFSIVLLATQNTQMTRGAEIAATLSYPPLIYLETFLIGLVVQALFSVTLITLSTVASLCVLNLVYTHIIGTMRFGDSNIPVLVFLGATLFITDPATSPRTALGKVLFGVLYAISVFWLQGLLRSLGLPGFYDKLLCVPFLNLCVRAFDTWGRAAISHFGKHVPKWNAHALNFAYMALWILLFAAMAASGFLRGISPGA